MDRDREAVTHEPWERKSKGLTQNLLVGAITRTSSVIARRVLGSVALRVSGHGTTDAPSRIRKPLALPNGYLASFIAIVVIPSFLCIIYLAFIASNQYVAEARFAVKRAQFDLSSSSSTGTSSPVSLSAGIPNIAGQDAFIISNYIASRAIVDDLAHVIDIKAIFQRPEADFWARLTPDPSAEELTAYWKDMVLAYVDTVSGIVTLTVRTFRPEDSKALAKAVIAASEKLANEVSLQSRKAVMRDAEAEVRRSEGMVTKALHNIRKFRDTQGFIDPGTAASSIGTLLMTTMSEKIRLQNEFFVDSKAMSPTAPTVTSLKTRIAALDAQIEQLKSKLTSNSPEGRTIAASLGTYEELELKHLFAVKLYTMAQDALERAKLKAEQQGLYIETFVPPGVPQEPTYPQRLALSFLIPLGLLIIWGILALLAASIEDHRM